MTKSKKSLAITHEKTLAAQRHIIKTNDFQRDRSNE